MRSRIDAGHRPTTQYDPKGSPMVPTDRSIAVTLDRSLPDRSYIRATVGLEKLGNQQPYWTATAEIYNPHGTWSGLARFCNGREWDSGGCQHAEIVRAFPKLAPFVALHRCSPHGIPMHAVANGRYFIANDMLDAAARHFRVPADELPALDDVELFIASRLHHWQAEAECAYALLLELRA